MRNCTTAALFSDVLTVRTITIQMIHFLPFLLVLCSPVSNGIITNERGSWIFTNQTSTASYELVGYKYNI